MSVNIMVNGLSLDKSSEKQFKGLYNISKKVEGENDAQICESVGLFLFS